MLCRLSEGDDVNSVLGLGVNDGHGNALEQAKCHEAFFFVTEAIILVGKCEAMENLFGVHEVETVVHHVPPALSLVPRKPHSLLYRHSVYTSSRRKAAV
jgi:hypothetical protein